MTRVAEWKKAHPDRVKEHNRRYYLRHSAPERRYYYNPHKKKFDFHNLISDEQFEENLSMLLQRYNEILYEKKSNGLRANLQNKAEVTRSD